MDRDERGYPIVDPTKLLPPLMPLPDEAKFLSRPDILSTRKVIYVAPPTPVPSPPKPRKPKPKFDPKAGKLVDKAVQATVAEKHVIEALKKEIASLKDSFKHHFSLQIEASDARSLYYTGLDNEGRQLMYQFLGQDNFGDLVLVGSNKKETTLGDLSLPLEHQFMLTLVKLRKNFQYEDMAVRFGIQQKHTSQVFKVRQGRHMK